MAKRILIIEDNPAISDLIAGKLKTEGFDVTVCADGNDGLEALRHEAWDFVYLNIMLPGMNGLEILEKVCKENLTDAPIVIFTNLSQPDVVAKVKALNPTDYVCYTDTAADDIISIIKSHL